MALGTQVEESLNEAQESLRNALAFAARTERPMVCSVIADLIKSIDDIIRTDFIMDKIQSYEPHD